MIRTRLRSARYSTTTFGNYISSFLFTDLFKKKLVTITQNVFVFIVTNLYLWRNLFRMSVADSTGKDVASNRLMGDLQMPNAQGGGSLASRIGAADGQFGWLQSSPLFAWFSKKKFPASRSKRIDVVARIVFPIIFAIFNLSYWTFYLLRDPGPQLP